MIVGVRSLRYFGF